MRTTSLPLRTRYRRESPQCAQVAVPFCTTAATTVVRGVSSMPFSMAYRMICRWAAITADVRKAGTSSIVGLACFWYSAEIASNASWAATSPSGCPPIPSANSRMLESRV